MHTHKWGYFNHNGRDGYTCIDPDCMGPIMNIDEVERRLNAVERLSAEEAKRISGVVYEEWHHDVDELLAYARILEGETT